MHSTQDETHVPLTSSANENTAFQCSQQQQSTLTVKHNSNALYSPSISLSPDLEVWRITRKWSHLNQRHLGAECQEDFLCLGGVGIVPVLVEPLLERPRHVLQGLTFVSDFTTTGTTPVKKRVEYVSGIWVCRIFYLFFKCLIFNTSSFYE